jgi:hypothetical protein
MKIFRGNLVGAGKAIERLILCDRTGQWQRESKVSEFMHGQNSSGFIGLREKG